MPNYVPLLNKNNLPTFMEEFIGAAAKTMDEYDVLGNDGWLGTVPFGKLAGFLVKQMVEIKDFDKALRRAVGFSVGTAFSQGISRNKLQPTIQKEDYKAFRTTLKQLLTAEDLELAGFVIQDFNDSTVVKAFLDLFDGLLDKAIMGEAAKRRVGQFVRDYSKINFVQLLERNQAVYGKLSAHLESDSYQLALQQFNKEKYYTALKNLYTEVTLNDDQGMTLDAIYVEPKFKVFEGCLKKDEYEKDNNAFVSQDQLLIGWTLPELILAWLQGKPLSEKFKERHPRFILLYGYPGQGKSSFCKRLLHDIAEEQVLNQPYYFAGFRNFGRPELLKTELLSTIADHLGDYQEITVDIKELKSSFLLLDGLDELLMKNRLKSTDVEDICSNILSESGRFQDMKVLVTSRYGYVENENIHADEVLILQIDEMDHTQQVNWLDRYRLFHEETWLTPERLKEINDSSKYLSELIPQPILLHMIASLDQPIEQDANRAMVYQSLFDQITDPNWKSKGQVPTLQGLKSNDLRNYLRELAYEIFLTGENYIHKQAVEKLRATDKFKKKLKSGDFQEALRALMIAFYFQEVKKKKRYADDEDSHTYAVEFLHKSLQEYLTAERIWFIFKEKFLLQRAEEEYVLEDELEALQFCQGLFGPQALSKEIIDYLIEIIHNFSNTNEKRDLAERMCHFLAFFLERDFLHSFQADTTKGKMPLDISLQVFYGFLVILVHLDKEVLLFEKLVHPLRLASLFHLLTPFSRFRLNLRGVYLSYANLQGIDLSEIDLRSADLYSANLCEAHLHSANLCEADLRQANLCEADLGQADLRQANLCEADLRQANLCEADLRQADLRQADLRQADLRQADLRQADFRQADLRQADLRKADLRKANLGEVDLRQANLGEADLGEADLREADLREANLHFANLRSANLYEADFGFADFGFADLREANLGEAGLGFANLCSANLREADLGFANLREADLREADLREADLQEANLINTIITFEQLVVTKSLYNCRGLETDLLEKLKIAKPSLVKNPYEREEE